MGNRPSSSRIEPVSEDITKDQSIWLEPQQASTAEIKKSCRLGIPPQYRAQTWAFLLGADVKQEQHKGQFQKYIEKSQRISEEIQSAKEQSITKRSLQMDGEVIKRDVRDSFEVIECDLPRTFPEMERSSFQNMGCPLFRR
ncbi:MAG: hypothetical protein EZS28_003275 [Streblomastix strix]|uniref:Rab-GAP TBC domain-containing protein n=1 Tax=Streblomastix strix TaxID=222440 RepID=A0A5J4X2F7_9EUKA|nr:MAG: hypothetical protein EZS28_003275 [Streblomastix strix]